MFRRRWLASAGVVLGLVAGCGPVMMTKWKVERGVKKVESALAPNKLDMTVYQPSHRVALATAETLKDELAEVKVVGIELTRDKNFDTPEGKPPEPGSLLIPMDHHACWVEGLSISKGPMLVNLRQVSFEGKTKEGEKVEAHLRLEVVGSDQRTVVTVQVGGRGDASGTALLIEKMNLRVQSPATRPGSPEERAALKALCDLGPKAVVDFSEATGEIAIKVD